MQSPVLGLGQATRRGLLCASWGLVCLRAIEARDRASGANLQACVDNKAVELCMGGQLSNAAVRETCPDLVRAACRLRKQPDCQPFVLACGTESSSR